MIRAYFPYHKHPNTYAHTHVHIIAELKEGRPCQPTPPSASGLYKKRTVEADGARIDDAFDKIFYRAPATQVFFLLMFLLMLRYLSRQQRRQSDTVERNCPERSSSSMRGICYSIHTHNISLSLSLSFTHPLSFSCTSIHRRIHAYTLTRTLSLTHTFLSLSLSMLRFLSLSLASCSLSFCHLSSLLLALARSHTFSLSLSLCFFFLLSFSPDPLSLVFPCPLSSALSLSRARARSMCLPFALFLSPPFLFFCVDYACARSLSLSPSVSSPLCYLLHLCIASFISLRLTHSLPL